MPPRLVGWLGGGLVAAAVVVMAAATAHAQRPVLSPHEVQAFDAGGCHFTINYGRPSKRGRVIWGGLVPWGHWWMPGADQATILTTSKPIAFDGLDVPAGDHTLYVLPDASASDLVVNKQVGQFHTQYDPSRNLGKTRLALTHLDTPVEQMTFSVVAEGSGGRLTLSWDDRAYSAAFVVK
jgi:hypothetical protein